MTNPSKPARAGALLDSMTIVADGAAREAWLESIADVQKPVVVSFVNAHGFNLAWGVAAVAADFRASDYLLRDGAGMAILLRALKRDAGANMNGTDLIPAIVTAFAGRRIALCGTAEPYMSRAADAVTGLGGTVVLARDGFAPEEDYVRDVPAAMPDLVILGMGMPRQERVALRLRAAMVTPVVIVNGGAILDFWAGRFPRAPLAWQRARMEWLFRLLQEPRRLWRRYLLGNALFLLRVGLMRLAGI